MRNHKTLNKVKNVIYTKENGQSGSFTNNGSIPTGTSYGGRSLSNERPGPTSQSLMQSDVDMLGSNTLAASGNRNAHGMPYRSTGRGGHMQHSLNQSGSFGLNADLKPTFG